MWDRLFKPIDSLQKGLEVGWLRNGIIRNNLANVETPNFKASDVAFESLLKKAFEAPPEPGFAAFRTHEKHVQFSTERVAAGVDPMNVKPYVYERKDLSMRMDGNNVDIEAENVKLAQNQLLYNTLMEKLNGELRRLKMAISEGKK